MSAWLLRNTKLKEHKESKRLKSILSWSLNHKFLSILVSLILFGGSIALYFVMPKGAVSGSTASQLVCQPLVPT